MRTYEETARRVLDRVDEYNEKAKKRNKNLRIGAAFACFAVFAVTAVFGVKAMMKPNAITTEHSDGNSVEPYQKKYAAFTCGSSDGGEISVIEEYPAWSGKNILGFRDETAPKTAAVTVDGVEYTGTYEESAVLKNGIYSTSVSHSYYQKGMNDYDIRFWIDSKTNELTQFEAYKPLSESGAVNEEKCRAVAERTAKSYLGDNLSDYEIESGSDDPYYYHYRVYKMIDGYRSAFTLNIEVDKNGMITLLMVGDKFEGIDSLPFDKEEADALISEKVKAIVKDVKSYSGYEYRYIKPVALNEGGVGAVYGVTIRSSHDFYDEVKQKTLTFVSECLVEILVAEQ